MKVYVIIVGLVLAVVLPLIPDPGVPLPLTNGVAVQLVGILLIAIAALHK